MSASASGLAFKMPQEPRPLPSLEADEESFVVLGKSIPDFYSDESVSNPVDISVISEAKSLINKELEALESIKNKPEQKIVSTMETSTALPKMPKIESGMESVSTISIASFPPDMSSEEVQLKIAQIIEENIHLKDTILQNNMTLKSQYEKITAWQKDVQRVHETHKEKLLEAKTIIKNLTLEKECLKNDLINVNEEKNKLEIEINKLREKDAANHEVLQKSDDNMREFQLAVANQKLKDLEAELEKVVGENKKLREEAIKSQEVFENKASELEMKLKELTLKDSEKQQIHPEFEQVKKNFEFALVTIKGLNQELSEKALHTEALQQTVNSLKAELALANDEIAQLKTQLSVTQTNLTEMEVSNTQACRRVHQLSEELTEAKSKSDDSDELCALKIQLDIYKADFEEERRARESIKEEKDRIEEDLQNLQRRNHQLQEEIELIRTERDFVHVPNRQERQRETTGFKCPKCNFGFSKIGELEAHVHRCIELNDSLP